MAEKLAPGETLSRDGRVVYPGDPRSKTKGEESETVPEGFSLVTDPDGTTRLVANEDPRLTLTEQAVAERRANPIPRGSSRPTNQ